ncbi:hypothetical protein ABL78_5960, partial [Leptomonas seymouri]
MWEAEKAMVVGLRAIYDRLLRSWPGAPRSGFGGILLRIVAPVFFAGTLSWPLRAVRTAVAVNYFADTMTLLSSATESDVVPQEKRSEGETTQKVGADRYNSMIDVWNHIRQRVGLRSLLLNGSGVDMVSRAFAVTLVWTVLQPATPWLRQVEASRAGAGVSVPDRPPNAVSFAFIYNSSLLLPTRKYSRCAMEAILALVGGGG